MRNKLRKAFDSVWKTVPMPVDYTCGCGLYVHPTRINPKKAIHCSDCRYSKTREIESAIKRYFSNHHQK